MWTLLLVSVACSELPATQVLGRLEPDGVVAGRTTFVRVTIDDADGARVAAFVETNEDAFGGVIPMSPRDGDANRTFRLTAQLFDGVDAPADTSIPFLELEAHGGYDEDEMRDLPLGLSESCADLPFECGEGQTCWRGVCRGACFDPIAHDASERPGPRCGPCERCTGARCEVVPDGTGCGCGGASCAGGVCTVPIAQNVRALAAGLETTCVLYDSGGVSCFGSNRHGEMGIAGVISSARPMAIDGVGGLYLSTWGDVNGTDRAHTCAGGRELYCWGSNQSGELGTGDTMDRATPALVDAPGVSFQDAVVGGGHTCGRASDGALYCWGGNDRGQLGIGTTVAESSPQLVGPGPYEAVSLGRLHTCAISDGVLSCWGFNESGQIGIVAVRENQPIPVELETPGAGIEDDWAEVSCGAWFTCARKRDGRVFCWGGNQYGNLGRVTATADAEVPGPVDGDLTFARIDCGRSHCCGLVRVDTTFDLYCWGRNEKGQLGTGDRLDRFVPTRVGGDTRWSEHFSAGEEHTCAVREGGELACWGDNTAFQLGLESAASRAEPSPVCP